MPSTLSADRVRPMEQSWICAFKCTIDWTPKRNVNPGFAQMQNWIIIIFTPFPPTTNIE